MTGRKIVQKSSLPVYNSQFTTVIWGRTLTGSSLDRDLYVQICYLQGSVWFPSEPDHTLDTILNVRKLSLPDYQNQSTESSNQSQMNPHTTVERGVDTLLYTSSPSRKPQLNPEENRHSVHFTPFILVGNSTSSTYIIYYISL